MVIIHALTLGANLGLFIFGILLNMVGPLLPHMVADLNLTMTQAGTLYSMRGAGIIVAVLFAGVFSDILGRRKFILTGAALWILGFLGFAVLSSPWLALVIWLIMGLGFGAVDTGLNSLVAEINEEKGAALNRLHFWFGLGAIVGPLVSQGLLTILPWQGVFVAAALLSLGFYAYMYRQTFPALQRPSSSPWANVRHVWSWRILLLSFIIMGYTGVGTALMGWMNTFLLERLGTAAWYASIVLALYSAGLAVGRLACGALAERLAYERLLFITATLSAAALATSLWAPNVIWAGVTFFLTGFFFAGLLPTSLATANRDFPQLAGTVTAVLITFGSIGRTIVPGAVGAAADAYCVSVGLQWLIVIVIAMAGAGWLLNWFRDEEPLEQ